MKRSRGRGRRQQNPVNRSYDSNGPDVRVRGTASQVYDKYQALARDAMSAGDRVTAENYLQHAEHYYRIVLSHQPPQTEQARPRTEEGQAASVETDENGATPLVLSRGNEEGEQEASDKPSRRRGPLRRRRNGGAIPSRKKRGRPSKSAQQTEAGAGSEGENVQPLEPNKSADKDGEAQVEVAVEADTGDPVGDVSAAANE